MKRDIEKRLDALEANTDAKRLGPPIWLRPGEPVPLSDDGSAGTRRGARYFTWLPVQEVGHDEVI